MNKIPSPFFYPRGCNKSTRRNWATLVVPHLTAANTAATRMMRIIDDANRIKAVLDALDASEEKDEEKAAGTLNNYRVVMDQLASRKKAVPAALRSALHAAETMHSNVNVQHFPQYQQARAMLAGRRDNVPMSPRTK